MGIVMKGHDIEEHRFGAIRLTGCEEILKGKEMPPTVYPVASFLCLKRYFLFLFPDDELFFFSKSQPNYYSFLWSCFLLPACSSASLQSLLLSSHRIAKGIMTSSFVWY